ncbi:MYCBP-associated protein [Echeneis naucrates]|uniref:MYCBP-associated protein n=1 Tax=Echeneis naucrates TaxID=173247 RepID=UPI0011139DFC|nr:MYCBP-associated protein [Echeneis naucrates]
MVLSHSILGSLEDFRSYLEAKGETELVKRIPKFQRDPPSEGSESRQSKAMESHRNIQSNALKHWHTHMRQRRRQQDFLSDLLDRPAETLLMNQANRFREFQEQREFLNQVLPLVHSGYGHRVGSEFWSLPQRYGDEISGITATLTQTEQGLICADTLCPASRTWNQSAYLQHQFKELGEILQDMDIKKPDIDGLEVIGSCKPFTSVTACGAPLLEKDKEEKKHKEVKKENIDPLAQHDDTRLDAPLIPALRFCGQLARWTGNSANNKGEVGIHATIIFEALTGERASSHLELHNEGSTAIFYHWQQLPLPHSFPSQQSQTMNPHFYFNASSGVLLPGDMLQVEVIFKSERPGIKTELWQLNTHPMLIQGASMQAKMRGIALYQDKTADQRLFIETKLEKMVVVKMCQSIVYEMLRKGQPPQRTSSPAELYITEEQKFRNKNQKFQYLHQSVEGLKRLWQEANPGHTWDFSLQTLRQVVLSLPEQESAHDTMTKERGLAQLNFLLLQLSEPFELEHQCLTVADLGQQLWRKLLDTMAGEATRLRNLLGLPEKEIRIEKKVESLISETDLAENISNDEKSEKKRRSAAKEERSDARSRFKSDNEGESKSPTTEKTVEDNKKRGKRRDEVGKHIKEKEKQGKEHASVTDNHPDSINQQPPDVMNTYTRLLHRKVYALMEDLVDTLCDLLDEKNDQDTRSI